MIDKKGLTNPIIIVLICFILIFMVLIIYFSQHQAERGALPSMSDSAQSSISKQEYEISKLAAEIRKIRSDTAGSLFWLKLIGLFITVGGAIGGYLLGLSRSTRARIDFENRKSVDLAYQSIVQELSDNSTILRAAAAVKLGTILKSFPSEWIVSNKRRDQLIQLTKQVIAAALAIETDEKVLKTLTINLVLHRPGTDKIGDDEKKKYADVRELDLSGAKAADAYWAKVDFTYSDFYKAVLSKVSFRDSILVGAQFRESMLVEAVLIGANCEGANFKFADLRNANMSDANLLKVNFENAKVAGLRLDNTKLGDNPETMVDISPEGDGSKMVSFKKWLSTLNF